VSNLDKHISFVLCDLSKEEKVDEVLGDVGRFDLVFGLHCCGGLAETAVELALRSIQYSGAAVDFCASTCCHLSNTHLASLTAHASSGLFPTPSREQHNDDVPIPGRHSSWQGPGPRPAIIECTLTHGGRGKV